MSRYVVAILSMGQALPVVCYKQSKKCVLIHSFSVLVPAWWNTLPNEIQALQNLSQSRRAVLLGLWLRQQKLHWSWSLPSPSLPLPYHDVKSLPTCLFSSCPIQATYIDKFVWLFYVLYVNYYYCFNYCCYPPWALLCRGGEAINQIYT